MDLFLMGNKIEIADTKMGLTRVTIDNQSMYVNAMVVSKETINYQDVLQVGDICVKLIKRVERKVQFEELKEHLKHEFGFIQY